MIIVVALMLSLGLILIFAAIAGTFRESTRMDAMVQQYTAPKMLEELELEQPFRTRVLDPLVRKIARALARFTPQYFAQTTVRTLELAGTPSNLTATELLGIRVISAVFGGFILGIFFSAIKSSLSIVVLLSIVGLGLGFYVPVLWLAQRARNRQHEIERALPDALDLLTLCVEAGLGFDAAIAKLVEKWDNELSHAFARMQFELRLGKARQTALRDMANRTGVTDVSSFIAAVIQADQLGAPIAKVLRIQSEQMRVLRGQRARERANTIPVKILFPLVLFIFPAMFVVIIGPAVLRLILRGLF